ncbi:MAG: LuxR C-terminal-related transcriptional regulator [Nitrospirota bacterium]
MGVATENRQQMWEFIISRLPIGVLVFDRSMDMVLCNRRARLFLNRFALPQEIQTIAGRVFEAIESARLNELFPGEVSLSKKFKDSPSTWIFRFLIRETPVPMVIVFIMEDTVSHKLEMDEMRKQHGLTRREVDVFRRLLDGLKNFEMAEDLEITEQTVKDHLSSIYMKFGVENRFDLIRSILNPEDHGYG